MYITFVDRGPWLCDSLRLRVDRGIERANNSL